jgi:hypothetical protein
LDSNQSFTRNQNIIFMRLFITAIILFFYLNFYSQNHVKWTFEYDNISKAIVAYGKIDSTWHTYSIHNKNNSGPVPTSLTIEKGKGFKILGNAHEKSTPKKIFDANFDSELFIIDILYVAQVPLKIKKESNVSGKVTYMVCDDSKCYPPIDVPFTINVKPEN